ncbi:GDT1-like protein 3 [Morella rubra]|uniref:GDT1 family protein n=1 Tax=Morella rubra TaxID=262757 RepID=A0A6A1UKE0_9ROSI|nr:GDT1-like protein 3 [Morella rubra]
MELRSSPKSAIPSLFFLLILLTAFFFLALHPVCAQESLIETEKEDSIESKDLGRRGKINLSSLKSIGDETGLDSVGLGLSLDPEGLGIFDAFVASLSMILVSEIGDETFIIAALMAMRHPKSIVLSGALTALIVMTVLSTGLGRIVPNLISRKHTNSAATVLYAFFGLRLLYIAWRSDSKSSQKKEIEEVFEYGMGLFWHHWQNFPGDVVASVSVSEVGELGIVSVPSVSPSISVVMPVTAATLAVLAGNCRSKRVAGFTVIDVEEKLEAGQGKTTFRRFFSRFCTPIFLESFVLTFLAEWGDRSQIATIAIPGVC